MSSTETSSSSSPHPLENEWVLWLHLGGTKDPKAWKDNMKQLCSFSTVEDFWRYFNYIPKPSEVFNTGDGEKSVGTETKPVKEYSLFKRGIEPEWGDPENRTGGEWYCRQPIEGQALDFYWQNLVLAVIGNAMEDDSLEKRHINGARVVDKGKQYPLFRLELWINTKDMHVKTQLRQKLMDVMTAEFGPPPKKGHPTFDWKDHST